MNFFSILFLFGSILTCRGEQTWVQIVNRSGANVIRTTITNITDADWVGYYRPDENLGDKEIPDGYSVIHREEFSEAAESAQWTMTLDFDDGITDVITVDQKFAVGQSDTCFVNKETTHKYFCSGQVDGSLLEISIFASDWNE